MTQLAHFRLIVHIGPGKTGSSAIQSVGNAFCEPLKQQGCYYLGVMFENSPVQLFPWQNSLDGPKHITRNDQKSENQLFRVLRESINHLAENQFNSAIWSNESTLKSGSMVIKVLNRLAKTGVKIVVYSYLRNHEELIQSAYIQWGIKLKKYQGQVKSFKQWITQQNLILYPKIEQWLDQSFDLVLKNYDAINDVALDFYQSNQIELSQYQPSKVNASPNHTLLAMWAEFNSVDDDEKVEHDFKKIANPSGILEKQQTLPNIYQLLPSSSDLADISHKTKEDKEKINQLLKKNGQPPLLSPSDSSTKALDPFEQLWELHMYSLDMIYALQDQLFEHKTLTHKQFSEINKRMTHNELSLNAFQMKMMKLLDEK